MAEPANALARLAENLLERFRSEEEPSAETLTAARVIGRRMRESGLTAEHIVRAGLRSEPSAFGTTQAAAATIADLERAKLTLERRNAVLKHQRDQAQAERRSAESQVDTLRTELRRERERNRTGRTSPDFRKVDPTRTGKAREHAQRTSWRIEAIRRAEPRASLETLAASLNEQGWSTVGGLPWTRDSIRRLAEHPEPL